MIIADLPRPPICPPDCIKMVIPIAAVLGLVKDTLPIDATVTTAHYDEATANLELFIKSDFFKKPE